MDMEHFLRKIKTNSLVTAILYAALGLVLLVWPALTASLFCTALGVVLIACGVVDIFIFLINRDGSVYAAIHLIAGVILLAVGVYVMLRPSLVSVVIPRIIGILICLHGVSDVGDSLTLRRSGDTRWTTALILGLVTLVLGGVLVADPFDAFTTVVRIIGLFLLYDGVSDIWITTRITKTLKRLKTDAEAESSAIDVDFTDVPKDGSAPS